MAILDVDNHKPVNPPQEPPLETGIEDGSVDSPATNSTLNVSEMPEVLSPAPQIAQLVSWVLHPFLIAPAAIVLILWLEQNNWLAAIGWAALCAAFVVMPGTLYIRRKLAKKAYSDSDISVREQRYGFYLFGLFCMAACFVTLWWLKAPLALIACFTAAFISTIVAALINRSGTKVSIHAGTMAGVTTALAFFAPPLAGLFALGTALVIWSRIILQRHTMQEAILGSALSVATVALVLGLFFNLG